VRTLELSPQTKAHPVGSSGPGQSTIGGEIRRRAELQPDHTAVVASGFAPLSYRELQRLIDEVRVALRQAGFGQSARVAVAIPNGPQAALAIVAVTCSAVSIPLNPRQTVSEIETCLAALRPDALLLVKAADSAARRAAERKGITIIEATQAKGGAIGFSIGEPESSIAAKPNASDEPDGDALAFILQTSGTSAGPKLIPTSHRNMLAAAARVQAWFDLTPQDRCLSVSPIFYAHGLHVTVFAALLSGGSVAFPTDASKFDYSEWFGNLRPTWYSAGPTLHHLVLDQTKSGADAKTGHSLRFVLSGGAPLPRNVLEGLEHALGVPVVEHYGSSEAMQICSNLLPPRGSKLGTVGVPWPNTILIVGEDGGRLPSGAQGEILVGGPTVVSGYLDASELNSFSFVDGWFKSGDIGSLDEDGFLALHGRKDDLINRGGEKISPVEIDDALMRHPAVAEAAAFPVPHPRLGEDVAAAVVLRRGMKATPIELRGYLLERLAPFKIPRRIVIRDQLPKGQTGKVMRRRLAEGLEEKIAAETRIAAPQSIEDTSVYSDLVIKLTEIWERLLKITPLPDEDFFQNGGDSLLAMEMLVELEVLTGRTISNSILLEAPTIGLLAQKLSERDHTERKFLIRLNSSGRQPPLFYFHGQYNWYGYSAVAMARLLGSDQPFLVVAPHGIDNEPIPRSIEAMAADRLPLILDAQPEGPYRLFGNCLGGIVAFEVARMLVATGKKVELVAMLDSPTINARGSVQLLLSTMRRARSVAGHVVELAMARTWVRCIYIQKFWNISWNRRWAAFKKGVRNLVVGDRNQMHTAPIVGSKLGEPNLEKVMFEKFEQSSADRNMRYACVMSNYFPKHLAVRVIYFSVDYGAGAWRRISSDLEIIKSSGTHNNLDFADIAKHLRARLQASK
jgi:acyl-CoA synthetase (AMP-forming)/AMP-acid ligase II